MLGTYWFLDNLQRQKIMLSKLSVLILVCPPCVEEDGFIFKKRAREGEKKEKERKVEGENTTMQFMQVD